MNSCRQLGVEFALDDFGTGYSSLSYLKNLPLNTLKIDQSFIVGILDNPRDFALVESITSLANKMGVLCIAEGVETKAHGQLLVKMGCARLQGFGIARPMPASAVVKWILDWEASPLWIA